MNNNIEISHVVELSNCDLSVVTGGAQALVNGLKTTMPNAFYCVKRSVGADNMLGSIAQYECIDSKGRPASAGTFNDGVLVPSGGR